MGGLGHTSEDNTGLIYMRARYYDPGVGRFISEDPARDGSNWFRYVQNMPTSAVDPTGESIQLWYTWVGAWAQCAKDIYHAAGGGVAGLLQMLEQYPQLSQSVYWSSEYAAEYIRGQAGTLSIMVEVDATLASEYAIYQGNFYMSLSQAMGLGSASAGLSKAWEEAGDAVTTLISIL